MLGIRGFENLQALAPFVDAIFLVHRHQRKDRAVVRIDKADLAPFGNFARRR